MNAGMFQTLPGDTPLSPEEQLDLIPSIGTKAELNQVERYNINRAREWATRPKVLSRPDLLTDHFAREVHKRMFSQAWKWAGKYRTTEKNLGWEPHRITEAMRNAFDDAACWRDQQIYSIFEAAIRLHHKLVVIHPWPNGNGRHARLMADIWCAAARVEEPSWGAHADLLTAGETRQRYLSALKAADAGDFQSLLTFARS